MQLKSILQKILDSKNFFRIPLVNRPQDRFLGVEYFDPLFLPFLGSKQPQKFLFRNEKRSLKEWYKINLNA